MATEFTFNAVSTTSGGSSTRSLSTLRDIVQKNLGSDSVFYTDTDVNRELNRALNQCSEKTLAYVTTATCTTVSGTYEYSFTADFLLTSGDVIELQELTWNNTRLKKINNKQMSGFFGIGSTPATQTGTPYCYTIMEMNKIWLYPTPSEAQTLKIWYSTYAPALSADGDVSPFPRASDDYLIARATAELYNRDRESGQFAIYNKLADKAMDELMRATIDKPMIAEVEEGGI